MWHFVALVSGEGWHVQDLRRAAGLAGVRLDAVEFPRVTGWVGGEGSGVMADGVNLLACEAVLVRMMPPGGLEQVVFRMDALHRVAASGVPVWNPPSAVEAAVDKYLALARLQAAGLPVPTTWVGESAVEALAAFDALGRDVVVKPLFGSEGRGLVRVTDRETAWRVVRTLERIGTVLYLQKYISNDGSDLRAFVLGDRVLGSIRRHAPAGDWRTNVAIGGRAEACALGREAERMALEAARAVGARVAGVDLLPTRAGGWVVLEVNAVPGWRALAGATGVDVALEIINAIREAGR